MKLITRILKKGFTWCNVVVFLYAACCLDGPSLVPLVVCCVTGCYLGFYAHANNWFEGYMEETE